MGLLILLGLIMFVLLFFIVFFTIALLTFARRGEKEENLIGNG